MTQQCLPGGGGMHPLAPHQQALAQRVFQRADAQRDGGHRQRELAGGGRKAAGIGHGGQGVELAGVEHGGGARFIKKILMEWRNI